MVSICSRAQATPWIARYSWMDARGTLQQGLFPQQALVTVDGNGVGSLTSLGQLYTQLGAVDTPASPSATTKPSASPSSTSSPSRTAQGTVAASQSASVSVSTSSSSSASGSRSSQGTLAAATTLVQ